MVFSIILINYFTFSLAKMQACNSHIYIYIQEIYAINPNKDDVKINAND